MTTRSNLNNDMGRLPRSPFSVDSLSSAGHETKRRIPGLIMFGSLAVLGVVLVLILRSRSSTQTGPQVTLTQSAAPDQSTIDNLTNSIIALQGQIHLGSATPGGGVASPITGGIPNLPIPATGTAGIQQGMQNAQTLAQYYSSAYIAASAYAKANPSATSFSYQGSNISLDPQSLSNMKQTSQSILTTANQDASAWGVSPISISGA